ncbi:hypothetical protein N0V90_000013 [Kalmusia sp. IMI 367209]|nr:hypothetical protein N0V90_000013 [Kalmusia sp. IMI 367209]
MSLFIWISRTVALLASISTTIAQPYHVTPRQIPPFKTSYLFTASVELGSPNPVPIPGGAIVAEAILGGTVTGPSLNATIATGLAAPHVYQNGTLQLPVIDLYGITEDGYPFHLHEIGVGTPEAQMTRIELNVGGTRYGILNTGFILATVNPNTERTLVNVKAYLVQNTSEV